MGQGAIRSTTGSERDTSSDANTTANSYSAAADPYAASYPAYSAKSAATSPAPSFLRPGVRDVNTPHPPRMPANASTPDLHAFHHRATFFGQPHTPPPTARHRSGRHFHGGPAAEERDSVNHSNSNINSRTHSRYPSQSEVFAARTTHASAAADYSQAAVSASEAQQRRDGQYLHRMLVRAAEEVSTVPSGELECLASGFLSIADYIFVAETVKGLSSLLLSESDKAVQCVEAALHPAGSGVLSDPVDSGSFNNSATTSPVSPLGMEGAAPAPRSRTGTPEKHAQQHHSTTDKNNNGVGALTRSNGGGPTDMSALPWAVMRDALLAQRASNNSARAKSVSGASQATLAMGNSLATATPEQARSGSTTLQPQRTSVFDDDTATMTDPHFRSDASGRSDGRSTSPDDATSTQTASPTEAHLGEQPLSPMNPHMEKETKSLHAALAGSGSGLDDAPLRAPGVTPLSTTLGSLTNLAKSTNTTEAGLTTGTTAAATPQPLTSLPVSQMNLSPSSVGLTADAAAAAAAARPLTLEDLVSITSQDEVLDVFLQSMSKKMRGLSKKLQVLPPFAAFRYCIASIFRNLAASYRAGTAASAAHAAASSRSRGMFSNEDGDTADATHAAAAAASTAKAGESGWVLAETVVEQAPDVDEVKAREARLVALSAMGDDVRRLFNDTKGLLLKALTAFANAMPLGINSRINNNYLLPTEAIPADFVGCGLHTSRRTEFFVSMAARVKMLEGHHSFQTPQGLLLGISQLSNLASQMISSFAIGAVLASTQKWRELYEAGTTNTDEIGDVLEQFATEFCAGFDVLCNEAFPTLRKQYPNVFVVSSFVIKEEDGGRPPMVTVAMSAVLKLLFLFAGGLGSIRADDRRLVSEVMREERRQAAGTTGAASDRHPSMGTTTTMMTAGGASRVTSAVQSPCAAHKNTHEQQQQQQQHRYSPFASVPDGPLDSREASTVMDRRRGTNLNGAGWGSESALSNSRRSQVSCLAQQLANPDSEYGMTDDVALTTALHVRSASVLVLLGGMLTNDPLSTHAQSTHESARLANAVSRLWRVLFQTAGLLPHGTACPKEMAKWLPLFPMYAVNAEAKRTLLEVYAKTSSFSSLCIGPIQREEVLQSTAAIVMDVFKTSHEARNSSVHEANSKHSPSLVAQTPQAGSAANLPAMDLNATATTVHTNTNTEDGTESRASADAAGRSRLSMPRPTTAHGGNTTTSTRIIPIFMSGLKKSPAMTAQVLLGLRSGSKLDQSQFNPMLAKELRQDLYDIAARQVCDPFLPALNLAKEARAIPLPGGIATFHTDKLEDRSATTLMRLQAYADKLVLVLSWKKAAAAARRISGGNNNNRASVRASMFAPSSTGSSENNNNNNNNNSSGFACPIAAGDEISLRWADPVSVTSVVNALLSGSGGDAEGGEAVVPSSLPPPPPPPQRHTVATVLPTTSPSQFLVVLDAPNYLSTYAADAVKPKQDAPLPASAANGYAARRRASSLTVTSSKGLVNRRQSTMSLQSMGLGYLEDAAAHAPAIADILLHRRQTSLLASDATTVCAWTNPQLTAHLAAVAAAAQAERHHPNTSPSHPATARPSLDEDPLSYPTQQQQQQQKQRKSKFQSVSAFSTVTTATTATTTAGGGGAVQPEQAVAMLLGWLLGQSPGNETIFSLPLPPLAFRILGQAVHLEEAVEEVHLDAADVSLQNPDLSRGELCQHTLEELRRGLHAGLASHTSPSDEVLFTGSPAVTRRQFQRLKAQLKELLESMAWNGPPTDAVTRGFWSAVLQGLRQTPLVHTPVFAHCCARTLRDVLCGAYDHPDLDFAFRESFILLTNLNAPLNVYRNYIRRCVKGVLDEEFSVSEKRLLLRFITGHTLRTQPAHTEMICLDVQHTFAATAGASDAGHRGTMLQFGKNHSVDKTGGAPSNDANGTSKPAAVPVTRAGIDATLQLLPVGRSSDNTLVIPNYFEALLMGSYRERVLGAGYPWLRQSAGGEGAAQDAGEPVDPAKASVVLEESDFQFAWAGLAAAQQETLKRRFRELLVQRLRAALYAFLVSRDDSMEAAWELADRLGLVATPAVLLGGTARDGQAGAALTDVNNARGAGGTFMRRHDGTLVFLDSDDLHSNAMDDFEELPFDDDDEVADDTYSESMEGGIGEAEQLLNNNSAFGLFGEERNTEGRTSTQGGPFRGSLRGSLNSDALEMGTAGGSEQPFCEDSTVEKMDQNGYHTAASFCFGDDADVAPPMPAPPPEDEEEKTTEESPASHDNKPEQAPQPPQEEVINASTPKVDDTDDVDGDARGVKSGDAAALLSADDAAIEEEMRRMDAAEAEAAERSNSNANYIHNKDFYTGSTPPPPPPTAVTTSATTRQPSAGLRPMAVAPARRPSLVTPRMSALLQHARHTRSEPTSASTSTTSPSSSPSPATRSPADSTTGHVAPLPKFAPTTSRGTSPATPQRRPSYALGVPAAAAAAVRVSPAATPQKSSSTSAAPTPAAAAVAAVSSANSSDPLMAEVDSGIRELFPDEDPFAI